MQMILLKTRTLFIHRTLISTERSFYKNNRITFIRDRAFVKKKKKTLISDEFIEEKKKKNVLSEGVLRWEPFFYTINQRDKKNFIDLIYVDELSSSTMTDAITSQVRINTARNQFFLSLSFH